MSADIEDPPERLCLHPLTITPVIDESFQLRQSWMEGTNDLGIEINLTCGAGLGSGVVRLHVKDPISGKSRAERFNITDILQRWADGIVSDLRSEANKEVEDE